MNTIITASNDKMNKTIDNLLQKFTNIRAGRANPALLDSITIPYYGTETKIKELSTISIPEARQLSIKPFDKTLLPLIEKAIFAADLGITPNNNGEIIFVVFPPLTEDRRKDFVKQVKVLSEEAKVAIRNIRQDANNSIKKLELNKDEEDHGLNEIQNLVNEFNKKIENLLNEKEKELMNI